MKVKKRVPAFVVLWLSVSAAAIIAPGCYGRNCEGSLEVYGANAGQGSMLDENIWQSTALTEDWLPFPKQKYFIFDLHALGGRTPAAVMPYLSANPNPKNGSDSTLGGGNIALMFNTGPNRVDVKNDTCSDYFIRLVVLAPDFPPSSGLDAGGAGDADATTSLDAGSDAGDAGDAEAGP
jgi:hypothetical protein